ncbi:hypothetical protein [Lysinibacillus sp. G4S2]|uniref:hypothetical protein n=1 Tax=Lysinibacillus sp. G4S2 TaxID=3055859 RepID=UPI003390194C
MNTYQSYRVQYFTLAHELFHLTPEHEKLIKAFDANNSNNDENLKKSLNVQRIVLQRLYYYRKT